MSAAVASSLLATVFCNSTRLDAAASQLSSLETPLANSKHAGKNISFMKAFMTTSDTKRGIERESVLIKKLLQGIGHLSTGPVGFLCLECPKVQGMPGAQHMATNHAIPCYTPISHLTVDMFEALHSTSHICHQHQASQPCRMSAPRCSLLPVLSAVLQGVVR